MDHITGSGDYTTRLAEKSGRDHAAVVICLREYSREMGCESQFDPWHASQHAARLIEEGPVVLLEHVAEVVGVCSLKPVDAGFAIINHAYETSHTYIKRSHRNLPAAIKLFRGVESLGCDVFFTQTAYVGDLGYKVKQCLRVGKLYKALKYQPVTTTHLATAKGLFARVGVCFLYRARPLDAKTLKKLAHLVRRPSKDKK